MFKLYKNNLNSFYEKSLLFVVKKNMIKIFIFDFFFEREKWK